MAETKKKYPKANHYCQAGILGDSGEKQIASDDGEPSRTAGVPMLEVLKHHDLTDVYAIVVRYFGGIKLGAGGLVRAYTKAVADALTQATYVKKEIVKSYDITFPYTLIPFMDQLDEKKVRVTQKTFLEHVTYEMLFLDADLNVFDEVKHLLIRIKQHEDKILWLDQS